MTKLLLLLSLLLLLFLSACEGEPSGPGAAGETEATIPFDKEGTLRFLREGEPLTTIDIEIAETDSARERGLMQRQNLPEQSGMLFLFEREEPRGFWMSNTPLALDILFVGADSQIVSIAKYTKPFSSQSIVSEGPAQYVVEVPAGFADTYGITEANRITWERLENSHQE